MREREKSLKADLARTQAEVEKERQRAKEAADAMAREGQQVTSLELRVSTQRSRIAELEGSLVLAQETTNALRKEGLLMQDRNAELAREACGEGGLRRDGSVAIPLYFQVETRDEENRKLMARLATSETKLIEGERKVEALANMQGSRDSACIYASTY